MSFPTPVREDALVRSHRRCCVCHEFAGRSVNVHHIIQEAVGCGLDIGHVRDSSSSGDVHTYWLTVAFTNASPAKQDGYTLELLFPVQIPIQCAAADYGTDAVPVPVGDPRFRRLTLASGETVYRGQTIQIVDRARRPLSYRMDHALYALAPWDAQRQPALSW